MYYEEFVDIFLGIGFTHHIIILKKCHGPQERYFYLSALDELVKHPDENPSIGIVLCRLKNDTVVEFAFRDLMKPMGIATYRSGRELPESLRKFLPRAEDFDTVLKNERNVE